MESQLTKPQMDVKIDTPIEMFGVIAILMIGLAMLTMIVCAFWYVDVLLREPKAPSHLKLLPPMIRRLYVGSLATMVGVPMVYGIIIYVSSIWDH